MKKIFMCYVAMLLCVAPLFSQHIFKAKIVNVADSLPLFGATARITKLKMGAASRTDGSIVLQNIPAGKFTVELNYVGFETYLLDVSFPLANPDSVFLVILSPDESVLEEVVVQSTRSTRTIANAPTRVEAIEGEEIAEKVNMRPANVSMILHESTGIQVQQTSATSANASIRIQGLDGKYTQLLKDGYPNFGGFSGGLSVLEIPPLDLQQVEIIKGPSSTLYGGGAIAGVVNFISKTPGRTPKTDFIINQSHVGQTSVGGFTAQRYGKFGFTLLGLVNNQKAYDVDDDDFTELPKSKEFTIHPKLFFYPNEKTTLVIGNATTTGNRIGGDKFVIDNKADANHTYFEKNKTLRNITTMDLKMKGDSGGTFNIRSSFSYFNRSIEIPNYIFKGRQYNSFNEVSYAKDLGQHSLIGGANFIYDQFRENRLVNAVQRDQQTTTIGTFIQDTWDVNAKVSVESGVRLDHASYALSATDKSKLFVLPRISGLVKWSPHVSSRIGFGLGYKTPTMFTEQAEALQYNKVKALGNVDAEHSYGGTADINYRTRFGDGWMFSINHMLFYTYIKKPLILQQDADMGYSFYNAAKPVVSKGMETNMKLGWHDVKLFVGYTYTDSKAKYQVGNTALPLVPKHKLNLSLVYEKEGSFKSGLEGYFSDRQFLNNGAYSKSFWELGAMAEKIFKHYSIYINAENFTDTRQSRYKSVVNGAHNNPTFDDIWTHTEGFVLSGGVKVKL